MTDLELLTAWNIFQRRTERKYIPVMQNVVAGQFAQYFATRDVHKVSAETMGVELLALRKDCAVVWGHKVDLQLRAFKSRQPMGFSERIYGLMREYFGIDLLNDAEQITDTTREYIRLALADGALNGLSIDDIVAKMRAEVPDLSKKRARVIARTETVGAANKASITVAQNSGIALNKKWLAVHDSRTRHTHTEVDGTVLPLDRYFQVGGNELLQPGDRGGHDGHVFVDPKETINCRCTMGYIPLRDGRGAVVRR